MAYLLVVEQHVVDVLDGLLGGLVGLEVDEAVAAAVVMLVGHDLAGKDVAKSRERVVQCLVINRLVKVLDEHVAHARLAQRRVTLRPHDAHGARGEHVEFHGVERTLSVRRLVKVDVGIAERLLRDLVAAHADREHWTRKSEALVELSLRNVRVKVAFRE